MVFAKAVANANGTVTIEFLMEIIIWYGVLKYICSGRGHHLKNTKIENICNKLGIKQIFLNKKLHGKNRRKTRGKLEN